MSNWIVDQEHSTVGFEVKHMMVSKVRGQFDSFKADVEAEDLTDLTTANIAFKFDVDSINTRNLERDKHLKSVDFFDVQNYSTIDFKSTKITKKRDRYKVTGDVTIKGITKPITFDVEFGGKGKNPWGVEVYGYEAEAIIDREEFGLTWNAALETGGVLVGKEVKIKVELELNQQYSAFSETANLEKKSMIENKKQEITSNEIHRMIVENLTDLVSIIDRNGVIHYVSPSFKSMLNYDLPLQNIFSKIHEDEQETVRNEIVLIVAEP